MVRPPFLCLLVALLFLLPAAFSLNQQLLIHLSLSPDGGLEEHILFFPPGQERATFLSNERPYGVFSSANVTALREGDAYLFNLASDGASPLALSLFYDSLVERSFSKRVFRITIPPQHAEWVDVNLTLPRHFTLSRREPNAVPRPYAVTSDGQDITLSWKFQGNRSNGLTVFYENSLDFRLIILGIVLIFSFLSCFLYQVFKRKAWEHVEMILSADELKVVRELQRGSVLQKDLAIRLGFTKPKMSKLVRKLEEKGLIDRKPHFRTNLLTLIGRLR